MAYITPNSDIWLLSGVDLEPSYTHTLYNSGEATAANREAQFMKFMVRENNVYKYLKYALSSYSYLRKDKNAIRVKKPIADLYDCNYMIFQNKSYENRYFYAFITNVEYINDNTTEIQYQIDVMQTWWYDYKLNPCFVEREHTATDNIGENLLPEPVQIGDYVIQSQQKAKGYMHLSGGLFDDEETELFDSWSIVMECTAALTGDESSVITSLLPAGGLLLGGTYQQVMYIYFETDHRLATSLSNIQKILTYLSVFRNQNAIASIFMFPTELLPDNAIDGNSSGPWTQTSYNFNDSISKALLAEVIPKYYPIQTTIDGVTHSGYYGSYTPRNKKLLTYPYCYFTCSNQQGENQEYKYEYFPSTPQFFLFNDGAISPTLTLTPVGYLEVDTGVPQTRVYSHSVKMSNFPQCSWATTDLVAKFVQGAMGLASLATVKPISGGIGNLIGGVSNFVSDAVSQNTPNGFLKRNVDYLSDPSIMEKAAEGIVTPAPKRFVIPDANIDASGAAKDFVRITSALGTLAMASNVQSNMNNGNTNLANGGFNFIFTQYHIRTEIAKIIDEFFDMYGYQVNKVKVPSRENRAHYTYCKTANCTLDDAKMPMGDAQTIQNIYNNGVTFWKYLNEIGKYGTVDNTVALG